MNEEVEIFESAPTVINTDPVPSTSAEPTPSTSACVPAVPAPFIEPEEELAVEPDADNGIFELLGDDPSITTSYGKEINPDLAVRLQHFVTTGLSKELRKDLQGKYLPPSNCTLIDAPLLNPEIKTAVSDIVLKRAYTKSFERCKF